MRSTVFAAAAVLALSLPVATFAAGGGADPPKPQAASTPADPTFAQAKALAIGAFERRYLKMLLEKNNGNITAAALAAGMDRSNFRRLLRDAGLRGQKEAENDA